MARTGDNSRIPAIGVYPQTSAPTFGTDLTELADDVAQLIGETEPTVGDLPASGNWTGRTIYVQSDGRLYTWSGSAWAAPKGPFAEAAGSATSVSIAAGGSHSLAVTFPAGRFSVAPVVITGLVASVREVNIFAEDVTSTGFTLVRGNGAAVTRAAAGTWHAIQMTPTTAAG